MKSLYDIETLAEVLDRINQLRPDSTAEWGKMNAAQTMEHCALALDFATGKTKEPRMLLGYILGPLFKSLYYNDTPYKKNLATAKSLLVSDPIEFEKAKNRLINLVKEFSMGGPGKCTTHPSSFYGHLSPAQHGFGQYKHLDHHLQQFAV